MPVWVSDPDKHLIYFNYRAEDLIGRSVAKCIGKPCYEVIRGRTANGKRFCREHCPPVDELHFKREIKPFRIRVGVGRRARWVQVVLITAQPPDFSGQRLVHCVIDDKNEQRFKQYLTKVMTRTPRPPEGHYDLANFNLTRREQEILALLADDQSLHEIAGKLHLSYTTIRNHVQHILTKLGVHSIMEAVALYLMTND
jgi:DNA-binding CsgD family transcriptional regulator